MCAQKAYTAISIVQVGGRNSPKKSEKRRKYTISTGKTATSATSGKSLATFLIFFVHTHLGESTPPVRRYQFGPTDDNCERRHAKSQSKYLLRHAMLPSKREIERASGKQKL